MMNWNLIALLGAAIGVIGSLWLARSAARRAERMEDFDYAREILVGAGIVYLGFYLVICTYVYNNLGNFGSTAVIWTVFIMTIPLSLLFLFRRSHMRHRATITLIVLILLAVIIAYFYPQIREAFQKLILLIR